MLWKLIQKELGLQGKGQSSKHPQSGSVHLLKKIQVLLRVAEVFPNVKEAEGLLLADANPVLVFPSVRDAIQEDPVCFPHHFLTHCNTEPLGVENGHI